MGNQMIIQNIELKDGIFYGFDGKNEIRLEPSQISSIYLKDIKKSKEQTI